MKFKRAVANTPEVKNAYKPGIQALLEPDRRKVSFGDTRAVSGSLNLDKALAKVYPPENRWDYGVGIEKSKQADTAVWIEVHPASAAHIDPMIKKVVWLKTWLKNKAPDLLKITDSDTPYIWIASKGVSFNKTSPQARKLAQAGVAFPCEHYHFKTPRR